jgi:hypothetical protein
MARQSFAAVLLQDGRVFMVGGGGSNSGGWMKADVYNPSTRSFSQTRTMSAGRYIERATLLNDGDVLIDGDSSPASPLKALLYHPKTNRYSYTGAMHVPRKYATATLLADGRVLVAGGARCPQSNDGGSCVGLASAEIYDPKTGRFTVTGSMVTARFYQTATLLKDGRVLIAGGTATGSAAMALDDAEIYNPKTGKFSPVGSMASSRVTHTATLLANGLVLITGGQSSDLYPASGWDSAELFDPITDSFGSAGHMTLIRQGHTATLLRDGRVLLVGGGDNLTTTQVAELYDPATITFASTGFLPNSIMLQTATLLKDGRVFIAGGYRNGQTQKSCELYTP